MRIINVETYDELSKIAAEYVVNEVEKNPSLNCCLPTGSSPKGMYRKLIERYNENNNIFSQVIWTKLDEWVGLEMNNSSTCESFLNENFFSKLNGTVKDYISFQSDEKDLEKECKRIHNLLEETPIDVCILGIGKNGHLGLNEPDDCIIPTAHVVDLDEKSKHHSMLNNQKVSKGITIGLYEILNAKKILLLVSGEGKDAVYSEFLKGNVSTQLPATFLWLHKDVTVIYLNN